MSQHWCGVCTASLRASFMFYGLLFTPLAHSVEDETLGM